MKLNSLVGDQKFIVALEQNPTAKAFIEKLPMTVEMIELNENEKYVELPFKLPTQPIVPSVITEGDLMLYGNNTIVLFYKSFKTRYSYTKIGKVIELPGLLEALGTGNVEVSFSL